MQARVHLNGQYLQIFQPIVSLVLVLVMNMLRSREFSSEMALHRHSMLEPRIRLHVTLARSRCLMLTELPAILVPCPFGRERLPAVQTFLLDH